MRSILKQGFSIRIDSTVTKYFISDGGRNGFEGREMLVLWIKQSQCKNERESSFSDAFVKMIDPKTKTADPENDNRVRGLKNKSVTVKSTVETYR